MSASSLPRAKASSWRHGWRGRGSARLRLTATFTAVLMVVGLSIVASVFFAMRFVPDYRITALPSFSSERAETTPSLQAWSPAEDATIDADQTLPFPEAGDLEVGVTISDEGDLLRVLLTTSLIVFACALAIGVWMSWVVAGRLLRPVEHLATAAREAEHGAAGTFRQRLATLAPGRPDDEFGRLATTFDDMLDRLDRSFEAQRRFAANASHELRTPLATTQAMLDAALALEQTDTTGVHPDGLTTRLREMNTRSITTVEALLTLSNAQSGESTETEPVDLAALVKEVTNTLHSAAEEARIDLRCTAQAAQVVGDRALLHVLVSNLVRNGITHNEAGGWLEITVGTNSSGGASLHVANGGARLDSSEVTRLTEPFYRSAGRVSTSRGLGLGLGLALVEAIASRHHATLTLTAPPSGGLAAHVQFAP